MEARFKLTSNPLPVKNEMQLIREEGEPSTFLRYNPNKLRLLFSERHSQETLGFYHGQSHFFLPLCPFYLEKKILK